MYKILYIFLEGFGKMRFKTIFKQGNYKIDECNGYYYCFENCGQFWQSFGKAGYIKLAYAKKCLEKKCGGFENV